MDQIAAVAAVEAAGKLLCQLRFKIAEHMRTFDALLRADDTGIMPGTFKIYNIRKRNALRDAVMIDEHRGRNALRFDPV